MTYWVFVLVTALVSGLFFYTAMRKANMTFTVWQVFGVVQVVALFGYLLSRFGTLLEDRLQYGAWPSVDTWLSPLFHWYGAVLGVGMVWVLSIIVLKGDSRQKAIVFFGIVAQTACITFALGKVGCFADAHTGCIGGPTTLPWGVTYSWGSAASRLPLHPSQLYSALGAVALFVLLKSKIGIVWSTAVFLTLHSLMEFGLEFLKPMPKLFFGTLSLAHVTYLAIFAFGVAGAIAMSWQRKNLPQPVIAKSQSVSTAS